MEFIYLMEKRDKMLESIENLIDENGDLGSELISLNKQVRIEYTKQVVVLNRCGIHGSGPIPFSISREMAYGTAKVVNIQENIDRVKVKREVNKEKIMLLRQNLKIVENDIEDIRRGR